MKTIGMVLVTLFAAKAETGPPAATIRYLIPDEFGSETVQPVVLIVCTAIVDCDILASDVTGLSQPAPKSCKPILVQRTYRTASEKADHRSCAVLRAGRN